jgi:hypothetical protein
MSPRTQLEGLASQTLLEITSENSTYVSTDSGQEARETTPTVIVFSEGRLSIENSYTFNSPSVVSIRGLIGDAVLEAFTTDEEFVVSFTGGTRIVISLRDEDFTCPEAASYAPHNGPIVVVN